jgi:predicted metal-dependent phosphoesterase TrpH
MLVELHCHSTCSDGSLSPEQVAELARTRDVAVFALTDHDTCDGWAAVQSVMGERALRAVELSCSDDGRTVHVLIYDVLGDDDAWAPLETAMRGQVRARVKRLRNMVAKLEQQGVPLDVEQILADGAGRVVGRPDVARALVASGAVADKREAFSRFLRDGGPADVPVTTISVEEALSLAAAAGARASLAHPHTLGADGRARVERFHGAGLEAIEAGYGPYTRKERRRWATFGDRFGLVVTAGSDFHGDSTPAIPTVGVNLDEARARALMTWLGR